MDIDEKIAKGLNITSSNATSPKILEEEIMSSTISKTEAGWWAKRRIEELLTTIDEQREKMRYKDNKWFIVKDEDGLRVYIKCECGLQHDISLDKIGNFIGRGTAIGGKEKELNETP